MSEREHDDQHEEHELYEEVPPRSIFAATWFRVLLVVIVVGVIGAVAIPYVLDFMNPPPSKPAVAKAPAVPSAAPIPATPAPEKPAAAAPAAKAPPAAAVETKPAPATARPAETKPAAPKPEPPKTAAATAEKSKTAMAVTEPAPKPAPTPAKPDPVKPDAAKADTAKPVTSKTETLAKADTKPAPNDDVKPAAATKPTTAPKRAAATSTTTASRPATGAGPFWVQVGAYRDAETAKKLAAKLREDKFNVEESVARTGGAPAAKPAPTPSPAPAATAKPEIGADQYDVFVTGQTPEELNKRLAAKGLAAEASGPGMVVKPSLSLRDAVALSKDLAVEGFKVQVRRAGSSMAAAPPLSAPAAPSVASAGGAEVHRVRVGAFADRPAAQEAVKQLEARGYKPYIARGD